MPGRGSAPTILQGIPSSSRKPFFIQETKTPPDLVEVTQTAVRKLNFFANSTKAKPTMANVVSRNRSQREGLQLQYITLVLKDGVKGDAAIHIWGLEFHIHSSDLST